MNGVKMIRILGLSLALVFLVFISAPFAFAAPVIPLPDTTPNMIPADMSWLSMNQEFGTYWTNSMVNFEFFLLGPDSGYVGPMGSVGVGKKDGVPGVNSLFMFNSVEHPFGPFSEQLAGFVNCFIPVSVVDYTRQYEFTCNVFAPEMYQNVWPYWDLPFWYDIIIIPVSDGSSEFEMTFADVKYLGSRNSVMSPGSASAPFTVSFSFPQTQHIIGYELGFVFRASTMFIYGFDPETGLPLPSRPEQFHTGTYVYVSDLNLIKTRTPAEVEKDKENEQLIGMFNQVGEWIFNMGVEIKNEISIQMTAVTNSINDMKEAVTGKLDDIINAGDNNPDLAINTEFLDEVRSFMTDTENTLNDFRSSMTKAGDDAKVYVSQGTAVFNNVMGTFPPIVIAFMVFAVVFIVVRKMLGR